MPETKVGQCDSCDREDQELQYSRVCREWYCEPCWEYIAEKAL